VATDRLGREPTAFPRGGASPVPGPAPLTILTVSELTRRIRECIEVAFPAVWIVGEVSNCRRHTSGHVYLSLKDEGAQIRAVLWRSTARGLAFEPKDGMEVIGFGRLAVYEPRGEYQIVLQRLEPKGLGGLQMRLEQLKRKLQAEGLFDPARKRPLPRFPRCVALVTSPTGAAVRDMIRVLTRRFPRLRIVVVPVQVQGERAPADIRRGIEIAGRATGADLMIVGRGGGSLEDLWAFNSEEVVRALVASPIPTVSAVGHEVDTTLADFAADLRAPTPSAAAELAVPELRRILSDLRSLRERLGDRIHQAVKVARIRLDGIARSYALRHPRERVRQGQQRVDELAHRLGRAVQALRERAVERVRVLAASIEALSPLAVLVRGYSITTRAGKDAPLTSPEGLRPGDLVSTRLRSGRFLGRVESIEPGDEGGEGAAEREQHGTGE